MWLGSIVQVPAGIDDLVGRGMLQGVVPLTLSLSLWLAAFGLPQQVLAQSTEALAQVVDGARIEGHWDIALRDLDMALGLDGDGDGRLTWDELRARHGGDGVPVGAPRRLRPEDAARRGVSRAAANLVRAGLRRPGSIRRPDSRR